LRIWQIGTAQNIYQARESGRAEDEAMLRQFVSPALGGRRVVDVARVDVERLHRQITKAGTAIRANRALTLLSKLFSLAVHWEWVTSNPVKGVARNFEEPRHRYLSEDEIRRLVTALTALQNQMAANALKLLLLTGARRGEVLGARWSDIDLTAGVWVKQSSHTKQKRLHRVPLSAAAVELLINIKAYAGRSPFVFPARSRCGYLTAVQRSWREARDAAGLKDVRIHDLRHTYASMLASAGQSLPTIGALLGHSQASTTQRYSHLIDSALREATEIVGRAVTREKSRT